MLVEIGAVTELLKIFYILLPIILTLCRLERTFVHLDGFVIHIIGPMLKTAHALSTISIRYL
jgi:hypothetical protein